MGKEKFTYKELTMTLVQVEVCLNSRPLTPPHEPSDYMYLSFVLNLIITYTAATAVLMLAFH